MANRSTPRFKLSRHLGVNICNHPKALKRMDDLKGKRPKKISEYGLQLLEKQKIKAYYNVLEKQFVRYLKEAQKSREMTGAALLKMLECRLDNLVYRLGFASSIRQARQLVTHGHFLVNNKKVNIPSFGVRAGDQITLREKSRQNEMLLDNMAEAATIQYPYLEKNMEAFQGTLIRQPEREEIPIDVNEILAIELYSK